MLLSRLVRPNCRYTVLFLLLFVVLAAASASWADELGKEGSTVRIGVYQNRPKVFTDENGQATGLFIDLFAKMAEKEGWKLVYVPCRWSECLRFLEEGQIDLMPDVAYSQERDKRFNFHKLPVAESWSRFYAGSDRPIDAMTDLNGKSIAVLRGSIQQMEFAEMMNGFDFKVTIVPTESLEDAFLQAQAGTVDVAIANHFFGDYFHREYNLVKTPIVFGMTKLYYATAEGRHPELLQAIDRNLEKWRRETNSAYYLALSRWMERAPERFLPRYVAWVIGITLGLLVLAGGMIFVLRWEVLKRTRHLEERTAELNEALIGTISVMSLTAEKRDPYTAGHQARVARLAKALAERLGLAKEKVEGLYLAGIIHDIGKISIPTEILAKPGALSAEEFSLIKQHPQTGYEILNTIKFPWPIAQIVFQHHERVDGSGYPRGLAGEEILMEARILAVADVVETMTLRRPYRPALGIQAALEEIAGKRGIEFDPVVVDACNDLFQNGAVDFFEKDP